MVRRPINRTDHRLTVTPAISIVGLANDYVVPISLIAVLVAAWAAVMVGVLSLRPRPRPARSHWLATMMGPPSRKESTPTRAHKGDALPLRVVEPDALPVLEDVRGLSLEATQLNDLAGAVLTAGRRPLRRTWHGVLVHGDAGSGRTSLVRALAGEHHVPLLVVDAQDLPVSRTESRPAAIFAQALQLAPCVLLVVDVDQLLGGQRAADAIARRRAVDDLASQLRSMSTEHAVVVVGTASSVDAVSPLLLSAGCFDRRIAVLGPDRAERERIIRRELVFTGATYQGDIAEVVRMTRDMTARQVRELVGAAVRSAGLDRGVDRRPVTLTLRDVRAGLHLTNASTFDPLTLGPALSRRVRRFAHDLDKPQGSGGLALIGEEGNGKTTIAGWLADSTRREVVWLTGGDLRSLTSRDLEAVVDGACARAPVLVVIDDLDGGDHDRHTPSGIDPKHLEVAIERLLNCDGVSVVITASDRSSIPRLDAELIDTLWVARPDYHDRLRILRHVLADAELVGTTHPELAARMHGLTRADVVDACHRALRTVALTVEGLDGSGRFAVTRDDFPHPPV